MESIADRLLIIGGTVVLITIIVLQAVVMRRKEVDRFTEVVFGWRPFLVALGFGMWFAGILISGGD